MATTKTPKKPTAIISQADIEQAEARERIDPTQLGESQVVLFATLGGMNFPCPQTASDDALKMAILDAWRDPARMKNVRVKCCAKTYDPRWGISLWIRVDKPSGPPDYSTSDEHKGGVRDLLEAVRDLYQIRQPANGKVPHPSTTSASTPAGIVANDPDAVDHDPQFQDLKRNGKSRAKETPKEAKQAPKGTPKGKQAPKGAADLLAGIEVLSEDDILVSAIVPSAENPRSIFDEALINEMAPNIVTICQLNPITVREASGGKHELIDGETRWKAAGVGKAKAIRAKVIRCTDAQAACLRLLTAVQRRDLNPIERAQGLKALLERHQIPQRQLAEMVKLEQGTISNITRLLELPDVWKQRVISGEISQRAARDLVPWVDEPEVMSALDKDWKLCPAEEMSAQVMEDMLSEAIHGCGETVPKNLKLTDEQRDQLRIRKCKIFDSVRELAFNTKLLDELIKAADKKRAEAEQKRRDKQDGPKSSSSAAAPAKIDPKKAAENAAKQAQIHAKRLYRFKVAWYQAMIVASIDAAGLSEVIAILLFLSRSQGNTDRAEILRANVKPSKDKAKLPRGYGSSDNLGLLGGLLETAGQPGSIALIAETLVTEQLQSKFEGWNNTIEPEEYELLARHFEIDMKRDWTTSFDDDGPAADLWDDFCKIWSRDQILELLQELKIPNTAGESAKRSELVALLTTAACPKALLGCEPVRLA